MKLWTCIDHDNHYVGVASVIVAHTKEQATDLLKKALVKQELNPDYPFTLAEHSLDVPFALVLCDGDY